jgi:glycerol-3-phosphate O-acyltransferase
MFSFVHRLLSRPLRLPAILGPRTGPGDPQIFRFNSEREQIIAEVVNRIEKQFGTDPKRLLYALNEAGNAEIRRLSAQGDAEAAEALGSWRRLVKRLGKMSHEERVERLRAIARATGEDIAGNFDVRVYNLATRLVPGVLAAVMKPRLMPMQLLSGGFDQLDSLIGAEGPIEKLRRLAQIGTLVLVPTHSSNLDSIALGYVLMRERLPPVVYGAGKNLFSNPIVSFFMHNLGAYRVDRRIRASLYKDVLKAYSCVMIERGYHSLFFPGGTRSRSGLIERRLKLGLAGTAVEAFARNRVRGISRPVFFVPTTINYGLVLEAETLVEDWLKESGKARYIIEDDEFSQIDRWLAFFRRVAQMESACVIRFGSPLDCFGNPVDDEGGSVAPDGRAIDPGSYVMFRGVPTIEARRDAEYTREMGHLLVDNFERESVLMATQIVAHVLFRRLVRATPGVDLFGRLRHRGEITVKREELAKEVGVARDRLVGLEDKGAVHLSEMSRRADPDTLIDRVFAAWGGYHRRTIVLEHEGVITAEDPTMLLYYQNRLVPYAERIASDGDAAAAREIARLGIV